MNKNHEVNIDPLTGLFNARYAMNELRHVIYSREFVKDHSVAVICADIFRLKTPHDTYGHQPIDDALCAVGEAVKSVTHSDEIACRYGGDEFLIILPNVTQTEANQRVEELREAAEKVRVIANGEAREHLVLSIGVACESSIFTPKPPHSKLHGPEALMRDAEADLLRDRQRNVERAADAASARNPAN